MQNHNYKENQLINILSQHLKEGTLIQEFNKWNVKNEFILKRKEDLENFKRKNQDFKESLQKRREKIKEIIENDQIEFENKTKFNLKPRSIKEILMEKVNTIKKNKDIENEKFNKIQREKQFNRNNDEIRTLKFQRNIIENAFVLNKQMEEKQEKIYQEYEGF